jgi:hypothetical protein
MRFMAAGDDHNRVIAKVAHEALAPLGLVRKGRSRTWLDDHHWWVGVVEFQPSSWRRGSYLNVGAMWLWHDTDDHPIYFGLGSRIDAAGFAEAADASFEAAAESMAELAATQVRRLRAQLPTVEAAAAILVEKAKEEQGWARWDAAVALGLTGRREEAAAMFRAIVDDDDDRAWWVAVKHASARMAELVCVDPAGFDAQVHEWIGLYRSALRLPRDG